jgi:ATP-dependent DNA helicase RecQ
LPYHAGLDQKIRVANQDKFLMEEVDVIVATIALEWELINRMYVL